jgi:predicted dinucleotide-binding enzyme
MSIGIIGAGVLGSNMARLLAKSGISATIANSRGLESLRGLVGKLGPDPQRFASDQGTRSLGFEPQLSRQADRPSTRKPSVLGRR